MDTTPHERAVKVTALVITYNHIRFVAEALDSALGQRTDFGYEVLISEDCSTDGTRELVLEYAARHPQRVRLLLSPSNIHSNAVVARGIDAARGEYVALLDGDDYWTSMHKLQRQADFLDAHPECSMCFHNARVVHDDGSKPPVNWTPEHQPRHASFEDIWMGNFIATCSTMFRRTALGAIPAWYEAMFPITDWPLHILNARAGLIGYIPAVMGVYRYHSGGLYSAKSERAKLDATLQFYRTMNANFEYRYDRLVRTAITRYFFEWAQEYAARGDRPRARECFRTALTGRPLNRHVSARQLLKMFSRLYLHRPRRTA